MKQKQSKKALILEILQRSGFEIDTVPPQAFALFSKLDYRDLTKPLIIQDRLNDDTTMGKLAIKYRLSIDQIEYTLRKHKRENNGE